MGTGCVLFVFATALLGVVLSPADKAQMIVAIANMTVVFLGAITGSLVTGQSFVDWRHGSQSQFVAEDRRESLEAHSESEITTRAFAPKHFDDESI